MVVELRPFGVAVGEGFHPSRSPRYFQQEEGNGEPCPVAWRGLNPARPSEGQAHGQAKENPKTQGGNAQGLS